MNDSRAWHPEGQKNFASLTVKGAVCMYVCMYVCMCPSGKGAAYCGPIR